jgi:hypothetical protein
MDALLFHPKLVHNPDGARRPDAARRGRVVAAATLGAATGPGKRAGAWSTSTMTDPSFGGCALVSHWNRPVSHL